jgi:hypothetical protein
MEFTVLKFTSIFVWQLEYLKSDILQNILTDSWQMMEHILQNILTDSWQIMKQ